VVSPCVCLLLDPCGSSDLDSADVAAMART
jgi:hypothetical protein